MEYFVLKEMISKDKKSRNINGGKEDKMEKSKESFKEKGTYWMPNWILFGSISAHGCSDKEE